MIIVDNHDDTLICIRNILKQSFCFNLPRHTLTIKIVKKNKTLPLPPLFNSCLTSSIATWFWRTLPAAFKASFAFWVCLSRAPKLGSLSPSLLSCLWTSWLDLACFPEWSIYDYLLLFMINNRWSYLRSLHPHNNSNLFTYYVPPNVCHDRSCVPIEIYFNDENNK